MPFCLIFTWRAFICGLQYGMLWFFFYATVLAQADAELLDELRRLEEQEKAILEDETATVTTEEDHDDRRQTIDSLDDACDNSMRNYVMLSVLQYRCS
jgi:hypothetical protein